jgi:hypothetical protein
MQRRILGLALLATFAACAHVDPDTYKPVGHQYGRDDGWFVDSSGNMAYIVNGAETGSKFDSSGNFTTTGTLTYDDLAANDDLTVGDDAGITDALTVSGATALNGGLTMDTDKFTVANTSGNTLVAGTFDADGDATFSGGAGAVTFDDSASSIVVPDNDGTALDIGASGATAMMRFKTTNSAESVELRSNVITSPSVYDTFGEGADKGIAMLEYDGTAFDGTAGHLNIVHTSWGNRYAYLPIVGQTAEVTMTATGMNIAGDQTDNDGVEIYGGVLGASGRPFIIGTDPSFKFCASVTIDDASGTDDFHVGFRKVQAANATFDDYNTFATIGIVGNHNPGQIYLETDDDGAGTTSTDTTDTWADGASKTLCVLVSDTGVVTYTNGGAAPSTTAAYTFDDGDPVIPFIHILQHGDLTGEVNVTEWVVAYQ